MEVITLTLGGEQYAIESRFAFEVFHLNEFSRVPGARGALFGVTVWRGDLLTLLDIRPALGIPGTALHDLTRVIVLGDSGPAFGMLADRVHEMRTIADADIQSPTERSAESGRAYIQGITQDAIIVLDAAQLLTLHA
jgi:purine-binding chemotaxis protein CheW